MQQAFKELVSTVIAPRLRGAGFKRRGLTFTRPLGGYIQVVSVQRSAFNSADTCTFTFNTGIFVPSVVRVYFTCNPPANPIEPACILRRRGGFVAGTHDLWFELSSAHDLNDIKAAVTMHLERDLLPYLECLTTHDAIIKANATIPADPQQQVFRAIFLSLEVDPKQGLTALEALVRNASHPEYRKSLEALLERVRAPQVSN
jgi:Domain of unknown function (DUF4304)